MVPRDLGNGDRTPEYTYPVIVGVDGSFAAIRAARWAAAVAEKFAAPWGYAISPTQQPIVVGVDHDHGSRVAIAAAFEFAHRLGLGIITVHGWTTRRPAGEVTLPFMIDWGEVENDARQHLSDTLTPWIDLYPDVDVTEIVESDKPSRALLSCSSDAQLLVVGSRGRGRLAGAVLGSTGLNLLHHSAIPVMICRSVDADR
jgi:nucleotide-binding universal stress UspA family protein